MPKSTTPTTNIQWNAINSAASSPNLVSQLLAGKTTTPLGTSVTKSPNVTAASTSVKSPTAPTTYAPSLYTQVNPAVPYVNPNAGFNNTVNSGSQQQSQPSTAVKSTTTTNPDGSSTATTYHAPQTSTGGPAISNAVNQYQPTNDLYGQITTGLANTAAAGSPSATQYNQQQADAAQGAYTTGSAQAQAAYQQAQEYQKQLTQSNLNEANAIAGINGQPIPLEFQQGQARVLQDQYTQQQAALGSALQGESNLANIGITGQGQGITGLGSAAGAANTQQGQTLSGLGAAGSLAAPQSYGLLNQPYNPVTDTYGGGGTTGALNRATQAGNIQAAQSNAQAVGTAPVNAQLGVYNTQLQNLGQSQVAATQIAAFGNQLLQTMSQPPAQGGLGINPYDSQYANEKINQLQTQFNSPQYATFNTNIAGLQARVSALLQTGEIPTAATAGAQAIVSGNATLASMQATLDQIGKEAGAITGSQAQVASTAYQQAQQAATGASKPIVIPKQGGGNYTFVKNAQGVWVVQ